MPASSTSPADPAPGDGLSDGPRAVVVMGVCGAGKTEIGRRLAETLAWRFLDAMLFDVDSGAAGLAAVGFAVSVVKARTHPTGGTWNAILLGTRSD